MADEIDKIKVIPLEDFPQLDQPLEESTNAQNRISALIKDINDLQKRIDEKAAEITPEFISKATREQIRIKKLELQTVLDLYKGKVVEINNENISQATRDSVKSNRDINQNLQTRIEQMFATSKFEIANQLKKAITNLYLKIKEIKEIITLDYLLQTSGQELAEKRSQISAIYNDFIIKYHQIKAENLTEEERQELISQKVYIETTAVNIDKFILNEINAKEKARQEEQKQDSKDSEEQVSSPHRIEETLVEKLRQDLKQLERKLADGDEKIKSLETKLSSKQCEEEHLDEVYEYNQDEMLGDPAQENSNDASEGAISGVKLGTIELPIFSGNLQDWEPFRDMFESLVHKSKRLSKIIKFHQLRTHLRGMALDTIRGYLVTGANYENAWEDVKKRFNQTDELVEEYIRKFFEAKAIENKANYIQLRHIVDVTNQMLRALPNLNAKVDSWDPMINLIICSKLNEDLRTEWYQKKNRDNLRKTTELLNHLESKAIELQPKQSEKFSQMLKGDSNRKIPQKRVFQIKDEKTQRIFQLNKPQKEKSKKECLICKGNHNVWDCNLLKKETAKVRTSMIKALGLCFKCLLKHRAGICDNDECEYCGGPHHIMLCFKKENEERMNPIKFRGNNKSNQNQENHPKVKSQPKPSTSNQSDDWDNENWNQSAVQKN